MNSITNRWVRIALLNFLVAAVLGTLLRYAFVKELKWIDYKPYQDAHSHLALLGWAFQGLFAFLIAAFVPGDLYLQKKYNRLLWVNQLIVVLIAVNFIAIGHRMTANVLLVVLSLLILYFIYEFSKDASKDGYESPFSLQLAKTSLIFLGISFIGVYSIIPIILVSGTKKLLIYYLGVQFFLHFQYNGWFVFAVFALLFKLVEQHHSMIGNPLKLQCRLLIAGTIFSFFLSIYWAYQDKYLLLWIAASAGIIQIIAVAMAWKYMGGVISSLWNKLDKRFRIFLSISLMCFLLKLIMQAIIIVPFIATLAFTIRNYVIAFLHLVFIGFLSLFLFGWGLQQRYIIAGKLGNVGTYTIAAAFIAVELILFVQGTMLWTGKGFMTFYYPMLFLVSAFIPIGLLLLLINQSYKHSTYNQML